MKYWDDRAGATLHLSAGAIKELKAKGVKISRIVNHVLVVMLRESLIREEDVVLAALMSELDIQQLIAKKHTRGLEKAATRIKVLEEKISAAQAELKELTDSEHMSQMLRALNQKIREGKYDLPQVKLLAREELLSLKQLGLHISDEWLERQITRVKVLL